MPRLFGTDGIRGVANVDLKPTIAYALGRATAHRLIGAGGALVVGQDTRRSGDMFVAAISAGATSMGVDVHQVGVVPTPALAFLAGQGDFAAGIMVSASHNPADDNGLKVLDKRGLKLDDDIEDELEALIWRSEELAGVGERRARPDRRRQRPARALPAARARARPDDLDATSGSSSTARTGPAGSSGRRSSPRPAPSVEVIHNDPDGVNINVRREPRRRPRSRRRSSPAGPTSASPWTAMRTGSSRSTRAATSSTGTRCSASSPSTGSRGACCRTAASSCRSSRTAGSRRSSRRPAGRSIRTPVGDKYILEGMQVSGASLGGEKSGHVIVLEHTTSGDGIVTALEVLRVMARARPRCATWPHGSRCCRSNSGRSRPVIGTSGRAIASSRARSRRHGTRLGPGGRILVRPSGTEPALRVMVEGTDAPLVAELADSLAALAGERLN